MKRYLLLFFSLFVIFNFSVVSFAVVERGRADYDAGYDAGYDRGYDRGFDTGETQGFETGHTAGYANAVQTEYTNWIDESMSRFTNKFTGLLQPISDAWNSLSTTIGNFFQSIENKFKEMMDYIKKIFVPTFNFSITEDSTGKIKVSVISTPDSGEHNGGGITKTLFDFLKKKFAFVFQIKDLVNSLIFTNFSNDVPKFEIEIYGAKCSIIDFSIFLPYKAYIHGLIIAFAYYRFIVKVFKKLPFLIGGF